MDLILLAKVLWRKKWILIIIPLIAAAAAYFFTMDAEDVYKSTSQLSTGFTITDQVQLTDDKVNIRDADIKFNNLMNSMNSAIPVNLVAYKLLLHDIDGKDKPYRTPIEGFHATPEQVQQVKNFLQKKLDSFSPLSTSDPEFELVRSFLYAYRYDYTTVKNSLAIERVPNTDYVQIEFYSDDPHVSALAANSFSQEFIRYYQSLKSERTGESVEFLKQLTAEKKAVLDEKLETQKVFKANNNVVDVQRDGEAKMTQMAELERMRDETGNKIYKLDLTIQRLKEEIRNAGKINSYADNSTIIDLNAKIRRMNERYITGGSRNQALLDSLNILREQLRVKTDLSNRQVQVMAPGSGMTIPELDSKLKDAEIEIKSERSTLSMLDNKLRSLQYTTSGYASKEAALSAIQKEIDIAQQEYLDAVTKYNEAKNRFISSSTLRQVLLAAPAAVPESNKTILIIALAAVSSFVICLFVIIGGELVDVSVRTPDKFKRFVGLPLIGTLNKIDTRNFNIRNYFNEATNSEETEMYKSLLRKFRHEIENMNAKVFLFTSPKKREGKTFAMFSLAYVMSLINKRVLIIDTNFKNNSLSQLLLKPNTDVKLIEGRKIDLLIGSGKKAQVNGPGEEGEFDHENSFDLINPTKYKNIFIVGNAGGGNDSPAEILSGRDFNNLIAVLIDSFDYILLEGAAMNDYSDTKELVKYADKVLAVFSAESSIKQQDRESVAYFKTLGKKFGGAILNKVDTKDLKL